MPNRVTLFVAAVLLAAVGAVAALVAVGPAATWPAARVTLFLCAIGWVARRLTYEVDVSGADGRAYYLVFPAAALAAADWTVPVAAGLTVFAVDAARRAGRPWSKVVFNAASATFATAASLLAFGAAGGRPWLAGVQVAVVPFAVLFVTTRTVNAAAITGVLALDQGRPPLATWRAVVGRTLVDDIVVTPVVGFLAFSVVTWGYVATMAIAVSLIGVNRLYQTIQALSQLTEELLELMVGTIEARDLYTSGHSRRVARIAQVIARAAGVGEREVARIGVAGLLHDVGKVHEKYAEILRKPERLTPAEWALMKEHPADGEALVRKVSRLHDLLPAVRHHHERWDGTGYPDGLAGGAIPLQARILAVADTIDAMTSTRPYRRGLTPNEVRAELVKWSGAQFDPTLTAKLLASPAWATLFEPAEPAGTRYGLALVVETAQGGAVAVPPAGGRRDE